VDLFVRLDLMIQFEGVDSSPPESVARVEWTLDGNVLDESAHDVIGFQLVVVIMFPDGSDGVALTDNVGFAVQSLLVKKSHLDASVRV